MSAPRILVLNGPNLAALGRREPQIYGGASLDDIRAELERHAAARGAAMRFEQSNHEGALVDLLEEEAQVADGCVINPGGLSHTSVVLHDAIRAFAGPVVEVHLSHVLRREPFRRTLLTAEAAHGMITGLGAHGYVLAFDAVLKLIEE